MPLAEPDEGDHEDGLEPGQPPAFLIHTLALGLGPLQHLRRKLQFHNIYLYTKNKVPVKEKPKINAKRTGSDRCLAYLRSKGGTGGMLCTVMEAGRGCELIFTQLQEHTVSFLQNHMSSLKSHSQSGSAFYTPSLWSLHARAIEGQVMIIIYLET